ncbi:hypothetical protein FACS1894199_19130 [Bacteroidia bacterium]|nr:hypothetical protein FACS1894199_19130 [Bacteroidia bacterium]
MSKELQKEEKKSAAAELKETYLQQMKPLLSKTVTKTTDEGEIVVKFSRKGNKHLYSDTLGRAKGLKKDDLNELDKALRESDFVKSSPITKARKDDITKFYYFKDKNKALYL